jgi:hypothetical protein
MNNLNKTLLTLLMLVTTAVITYNLLPALDADYVRLEHTKSGTFIINKGHIFTVSELVTDDSTAYKMREVK